LTRARNKKNKKDIGDDAAIRSHTTFDQVDLQDCKLSGPQAQDWHQSETYDEKGDCGEVQGTKDEQAVPTANWNVKVSGAHKPRQDMSGNAGTLAWSFGYAGRAPLARVGVDWVGAMWPLVHRIIRCRRR
jgi:hypothetical protein